MRSLQTLFTVAALASFGVFAPTTFVLGANPESGGPYCLQLGGNQWYYGLESSSGPLEDTPLCSSDAQWFLAADGSGFSLYNSRYKRYLSLDTSTDTFTTSIISKTFKWNGDDCLYRESDGTDYYLNTDAKVSTISCTPLTLVSPSLASNAPVLIEFQDFYEYLASTSTGSLTTTYTRSNTRARWTFELSSTASGVFYLENHNARYMSLDMSSYTFQTSSSLKVRLTLSSGSCLQTSGLTTPVYLSSSETDDLSTRSSSQCTPIKFKPPTDPTTRTVYSAAAVGLALFVILIIVIAPIALCVCLIACCCCRRRSGKTVVVAQQPVMMQPMMQQQQQQTTVIQQAPPQPMMQQQQPMMQSPSGQQQSAANLV